MVDHNVIEETSGDGCEIQEQPLVPREDQDLHTLTTNTSAGGQASQHGRFQYIRPALAEALRDASTALHSTLSLHQILERILNNVGRVVPHDGANIALIAGDEAHVVLCHGHYSQVDSGDITGMRLPIARFAILQRMMRAGETWRSADTASDPDWLFLARTDWVASYLGAPIQHEGEVLGFLNLDSRTPNFFTTTHAEHLQAFADQVAIAVQSARLFQDLERHSESLKLAAMVRTTELYRAMDQLAATLDNSPDAILLLRRDGTIERGNRAFHDAFRYEQDELKRAALTDFVTPDGAERLQTALADLWVDGRKRHMELLALRKDRTTFAVEIALAPISENDKVKGAVSTFRDISRLKVVNQIKESFLANVSHELRTPITNLKLYHALLQRNPERSDVYLGRLERGINRLNRTVEELLHLSRLDRDELPVNLKTVDLNQLVRHYVDRKADVARRKSLRLAWEPEPGVPYVRADTKLLEQVVGNLLDNALAYTPAGGQIAVRLLEQRRPNGTWVGIRVHDNGPGIPEAELPHLFERFFRGELAHETGQPGTGLGLAIAQELVARHQGQIQVESKTGEHSGTIFTAWFPAT